MSTKILALLFVIVAGAIFNDALPTGAGTDAVTPQGETEPGPTNQPEEAASTDQPQEAEPTDQSAGESAPPQPQSTEEPAQAEEATSNGPTEGSEAETTEPTVEDTTEKDEDDTTIVVKVSNGYWIVTEPPMEEGTTDGDTSDEMGEEETSTAGMAEEATTQGPMPRPQSTDPLDYSCSVGGLKFCAWSLLRKFKCNSPTEAAKRCAIHNQYHPGDCRGFSAPILGKGRCTISQHARWEAGVCVDAVADQVAICSVPNHPMPEATTDIWSFWRGIFVSEESDEDDDSDESQENETTTPAAAVESDENESTTPGAAVESEENESATPGAAVTTEGMDEVSEGIMIVDEMEDTTTEKSKPGSQIGMSIPGFAVAAPQEPDTKAAEATTEEAQPAGEGAVTTGEPTPGSEGVEEVTEAAVAETST